MEFHRGVMWASSHMYCVWQYELLVVVLCGEKRQQGLLYCVPCLQPVVV